uniref:Uncharacterized protein n=1 Tax=Nelumbo nucifera TaxID=4432 RepID=A0A822ZAC8_NELNU|nr:TPA_asm: hypothetical protein HUJ06_009119 [Nelumbo nucifera]
MGGNGRGGERKSSSVFSILSVFKIRRSSSSSSSSSYYNKDSYGYSTGTSWDLDGIPPSRRSDGDRRGWVADPDINSKAAAFINKRKAAYQL